MSKVHVYIDPFDDDGNYTGFQEVTKDVISLGTLKQQLDQTEYDIGILRNSSVSIKMQNSSGKYSDVGENINSIFRNRRGGSKVRITWEPGNSPLICGFFNAGDESAIISEELTVFEGLLNDYGTKSDIEVQDVDFKILGYDSILSEILIPFSSLGTETFSSLISKMVNQTGLTELISIGTINVGQNETIDDLSGLENKTVRNSLRDVLFHSNSVLYIKDNVLKVANRDANLTPDPAFQFYGESALRGIENILDIKGFRSGINKTFNYWRWKDTALLAQETTSTQKYGIRDIEVGTDLITDNGKRQNILNSNRDEFGIPRREFNIETFLTPSVLDVFLLDRVSIDYPSLGVEESGQKVAVYGQPTGYEVDYYATDLFPIQIFAADRWKVISREINFKNDTIKFGVREIIT